MLRPEQFDLIELRCWEHQLVAALFAVLSPDQAIRREVIAVEVREATAKAMGLGLKGIPDVSHFVVMKGIMGKDSDCAMPVLRSDRAHQLLATQKLSEFVVRYGVEQISDSSGTG